MESRYYYAFDDINPARSINACSMRSEDHPIIVNCAGNLVSDAPFSTDNVQGREDYYYIYVVSGSMELANGDRPIALNPGDVAVFAPGYRYKYTYSGGARLSYMWVHFTGSYAERLLSDCLGREFPLICSTKGDNGIVGGFRRLFECFETGGKLRAQALACSLGMIILATASALKSDTDDRNLERSLRYIHSSYSKDIGVNDLAAMENMSYFSYIKLFSARMGVPPATYIIKLRMNTACDILVNTDMSIKQVGIAVGYRDSHFFSRVFKKHTGVSPKAYREAGYCPEASQNAPDTYNE